MYELKFQLQGELGRLLKTNKIDVVILNLTQNPEFKYKVIKNGSLIYKQEPFKFLVEPRAS